MRNRRVNSITYGAIICALVGVLLLINRQFANFLDLYLFWIIPLPVIIYCIKFDCKQAIIMCVAMVLTSIVTTGFNLATMFYVTSSCVAGVAYGYGVNHGKSATVLICSVIAVSLVVMFISTFVFSAFFGYDIAQEIAWLQGLMQETLSTLTSQADNLDFSKFLDYNFLFKLYIISCILTSVLEGILVHFLAFIVLKRLKMTLPPMKSIGEIYAPTWMKVFVFGTIVAQLMAQFTSITQYDDIIMPLAVIANILCFTFGYIYFATVMALTIKNKNVKLLITIALFLFLSVTASLLVIFGIFDMFTNSRKRMIERSKYEANQTR